MVKIEMKKLLLIALIAVAAAACTKSNPTDRVIKVMEECTEQLNRAKTTEEADKILTQLGEQIESIKKDNADYTPSEEDKKRIQQAAGPLSVAMMKVVGMSMQTAPEPMDPAPAVSDETTDNK